MKRKALITILTIIFTFMPLIVLAATDDLSNTSVVNSCVSSGECIEVCNYEIYMYNVKTPALVTIFYYNNKNSQYYDKWQIGYRENVGKKDLSDPNSFGYTFSTRGLPVFISSEESINLQKNKICPRYAYLDTQFVHEICLTNNTSYCVSEKSGIGTSFKADKIAKTGDYTYSNMVDRLKNLNDYLSDNDLYEGKEKVQEKIETSIKNIIASVLDGGEMPDTFKIQVYQDKLTIISELETNLQNRINVLKDKTEQDYREGIIDSDTYNKRITNLNDLSNIYSSIFSGFFGNGLEIVPLNCDSMLGSPYDAGTPAYYLNIAFSVIRYVAIVLLVVLTVIDFVGAVASSDNDIMKKTVNKSIKRAILCVVIFVLPTLIKVFLTYLNDRALDLCGIGG